MRRYWLCVTNEDNWRVVRERKVWGVPRRRRKIIERVIPGDLLVIYVAPRRIGGIFEVISKPYESQEKVFKEVRGESFPYRVELSPVRVLLEPVEAVEVMRRLSFIPDGRYWSAPLRRGMVEMTEEDYHIIETYLR
jgi:predicted RNA-binding protein